MPRLTSGGSNVMPNLARVLEQHLELVGVVHFDRHVGAVELGRVVHLQPRRVVRQQRVGGGVRLVEAVARELLHQVEDLVGLGCRDAVLRRALAEDLAVLGHLLGLLLAHRAAQQVGAAERVAAQDLRGLHHLLLVDHDPVGLAEHLDQAGADTPPPRARACARRRWGSGPSGRAGTSRSARSGPPAASAWRRAACPACRAIRTGTPPRSCRRKTGGRCARRPAGSVSKAKSRRSGVARDDELLRELQDRQRGQAQEVELHQADRLDVVLVVLAHRGVAARLLVQRAEIGDACRARSARRPRACRRCA